MYRLHRAQRALLSSKTWSSETSELHSSRSDDLTRCTLIASHVHECPMIHVQTFDALPSLGQEGFSSWLPGSCTDQRHECCDACAVHHGLCLT
jgi:hypothetical protein